jgi:protocatechuate 3,4-dioxygenase beta subunit
MVGHHDELVTQMYFDGEPLNDKDRFLESAGWVDRELLIARLLPPTPDLEPNSRLVMFDIVTLVG